MTGHKNRMNWISERFSNDRLSPKNLLSYVGNSIASPRIKGFLFCIWLNNLHKFSNNVFDHIGFFFFKVYFAGTFSRESQKTFRNLLKLGSQAKSILPYFT